MTRQQLLAAGMDSAAIDRRIVARRLTRVRRGIYRLGPIAQPLEREMAAILACGGRAVLSNRSAASLHKLLPYPAKDAFVHVTVTGSDRGRKPGIRIHRTRHLPEDEITRRHNIPVTTPARALLDLAPTVRPATLEQLVAEAHRKRLATHKALHTLIARYPRRPGVPALRNLLQGAPQFARSMAERRLLEALRRAGFEPEANARLDGYEVDLLLPEQRVVVEVDGHPFQSTRPDRRRDYGRDADLQARGYRVIRVDADDPPERTIALVARVSR